MGVSGPEGGGAAAYQGPIDVVASPVACWALRACSNALAGTKTANICNSGDANCADVNSLANGKFDVTTAQGAPLNCGGAGGTCTVKTIYDQTANANDLSQVTAATRPTLVFNCINTSLPCMAFNGSQFLTRGTFSSSAAQPFTVVGLAERTSGTGNSTFFSTSTSTGVQFFFAGANLVAIYSGSALPSASQTDNAFHALAGAYNTTSSSITVDGTTTSGLDLVVYNSLGANTCMGSDATSCAANALTGRVTEVAVWASGFNGTQLTNMCHNQRLFWGTTGSC
jgi:hypothetical protein